MCFAHSSNLFCLQNSSENSMKIKFALPMITLLILIPAVCVQAQKLSSVYTSLETKSCKTLESSAEEAGWYLGECPGIAGYKLRLSEGDIRQSIAVVAPNKKQYELGFGSVSASFSYVGAKAEWRVSGTGKTLKPTALIVRFNASKGDDSSKNDSYLVISKITKNKICITDVVNPSANQNLQAQKLADTAAAKPCKFPE